MAEPIPIANKKRKKKQKSKPQITKNVLLTPYKRSWPILPVHQQQEFNDTFYVNLSLLVPQKQPKVPWSALKDISREMRKDIRQRYRKPIEIDLNIRQSLIFGVNECTKALERRQLVAVLISSDCNPEMMVNHVIRNAEMQKIAVLVVESLKKTLLDVIGFSCVCLGFRNDLISEKLKETVEFVYKIKNMPIVWNKNENIHSNNNTTSNLSLDELSSSIQENVDFNTNSLKNLNNPNTDLFENQIFQIKSTTNELCTESVEKTAKIDSTKNSITALYGNFDSTDINENGSAQALIETIDLTCEDLIESPPENLTPGPYLFRTCTNKRAFEPPKGVNSTRNAPVLQSHDDFIALSDDLEVYLPSKIKKVTANKRKKKKKKRKNTE